MVTVAGETREMIKDVTMDVSGPADVEGVSRNAEVEGVSRLVEVEDVSTLARVADVEDVESVRTAWLHVSAFICGEVPTSNNAPTYFSRPPSESV